MSVCELEPRGALDGLLALLLRALLRWALRPVFAPRFSIRFQRRWLGLVARLQPWRRGVVLEPGTAGGVPGEWLRPRRGPARKGAILYLHGGAFCVGSPRTHRALTAALARATGLPVFALDYRLAPEHRFPAAVDDAVAACLALQGEGPVVLAGDSAGGGLAAGAAVRLRDAGHPAPAALLLLSPLVDHADLPALGPPPPGEAMLSHAWMAACSAHYLGAEDARHPVASPLRADLRGLPPTLVQAGTDELLLPQSLAFVAALEAAGVDARCEVTRHRWHVFQAHAGLLPSAGEAVERAADFVARALEGRTRGAVGPGGPPARHEVVILGAGMSGLCMAIQLRRAGLRDFVVLERSPGLGGTWWDNRYPGAHVDVPAPLYSFSFEPNPAWERRFAAAPEIHAYMERTARRHGVTPHLRFGARLTQATFDASAGEWELALEGGERLRARFFVCSTGPLSQARLPDLPGLPDYRGRLLHSARWTPGADLRGQRVAVIGTGSSAAQLIPPVAADAARLHVFQRTANWVLPRFDRRYGALDRLLARLPPYAALTRSGFFHVLEVVRRGFDEGTLVRRGLLALAGAHLRRQVPDPALRARLRPTYALGCKRLLFSNDLYPALSRPGVELVTDAITRVTPRGVVTADGQERPVDTLVCATGFDTVHLLSSLEVIGLGGTTLRAAWAEGPEAHHGITVAGFPNLFLLLGPNTATGHTSTLLFIEPQVRYAIACMREVRRGGHRWIGVRAEVQREHNRRLQERLAGSVWSTCRSWYRMESGKVVAIYPGFTREYLEATAAPAFEEFQFG